MHKAYLLIGGNMGNRVGYLEQAASLIGKMAGRVTRCSSIYETAAWGKMDQAAFLNQVLELETEEDAMDLMTTLLLIEEKMGRRRLNRYGPRIIDIDILLFDQQVHDTAHIAIPHPQLPNRRFALVPLAELASDLVHPVEGVTIKVMLDECPDELAVNKITL